MGEIEPWLSPQKHVIRKDIKRYNTNVNWAPKHKFNIDGHNRKGRVDEVLSFLKVGVVSVSNVYYVYIL